jgi:hypothetical protein
MTVTKNVKIYQSYHILLFCQSIARACTRWREGKKEGRKEGKKEEKKEDREEGKKGRREGKREGKRERGKEAGIINKLEK